MGVMAKCPQPFDHKVCVMVYIISSFSIQFPQKAFGERHVITKPTWLSYISLRAPVERK